MVRQHRKIYPKPHPTRRPRPAHRAIRPRPSIRQKIRKAADLARHFAAQSGKLEQLQAYTETALSASALDYPAATDDERHKEIVKHLQDRTRVPSPDQQILAAIDYANDAIQEIEIE